MCQDGEEEDGQAEELGEEKEFYMGNINTKHLVPKDLMIFHQNIRNLNNKSDEILNNIESNPPHILCFTEHHLKSYQLDKIFFQNYQLGAEYCR